jgi:hypothetical protein
MDLEHLSVAEALLKSQRPRAHGTGTREAVPAHATIAISREVGALGETVAAEVGRRLDCRVYGREIVDKIAAELRQPVALLRRMDERPIHWVEDWIGSFGGPYNRVGMDTYINYLIATIRAVAEMERCVIVGRGAPFFLRPEYTLRVRLIADRADRIKVVESRRHVSEAEAIRWMEQTENERSTFARRNFGIDPADPHFYDLLLNSSRMTVAECAEHIVQGFAHREFKIGAQRTGNMAESDVVTVR